MSITRIRLEGKGDNRDALTLELVVAGAELREKYGGEWEDEGDGWSHGCPVILPAKDNKFWGHYTMRRKQ